MRIFETQKAAERLKETESTEGNIHIFETEQPAERLKETESTEGEHAYI